MKKRSQAGIISTILLTLLAITLIVMITNVIVPFVKKELKESSCIDLLNKLKITSDPKYTCYNSSQLFVKIHRGDDEEKIEGFVIIVKTDSGSKRFEIKNGTSVTDVKMYGSSGNTLILPDKNEEKTYNITLTETPKAVSIYPFTKEEECPQVAHTLNSIPSC